MRLFPGKGSPVMLVALAVGLAGCADSAAPVPVEASESAAAASTAPEQVSEQVHRFGIGQLEAIVLKDGDLAFPNDGSTIGLGRSPDEVGALLEAAGEPVDMLHLSIQVLLVKAADRVMLFDAGAGPVESADAGRLPQALRAAGLGPEQITDILISHGHWDHIGGVVDAQGNPGFANATIRMSAPEWQALQADEDNARMVQAIAGQVETFAPGGEVLPGVTSVEMDGHTPGHSAYRIASGDEQLLYIGDSAHHYVVSVQRPHWTIAFDRNAPLAEHNREALLARAADESLPVHSPHFPFPGLGHVERGDGEGFVWVPQD